MKPETANNLLALVKNNYNKIAVDFDITRKKEIWPEVRKLAAELERGSKILDVGCGNGRLLEALPVGGIEYWGVDNSEELIKLARKNYPQQRFLVGDILKLEEISENNFDYIFCLAVLPHIPSEDLRVRALQGLKSKLGQHGKIIISAWNLWPAAGGRKNYRQSIFLTWLSNWFRAGGLGRLDFGDLIFPWKNSQGEIISKRYYHAFTTRELRRLGKKAGFLNFELKKDKFNYWLILK